MDTNFVKSLKVSDNGRFLVTEDNIPFFWLADTAWELFNRLNREEAIEYLENRSGRGFTVIQAVALAECDGILGGNAYGRKPLLQNSAGEYDPTLPDLSGDEGASGYNYWEHVDFIIDYAARLGIYIALLPTWGDKFNKMWGKGPVIFKRNNAGIYGKWLGSRYKDRTNIIWVLGGDRPLHTSEHFAIINAMAEGLKEGDEGSHLMTFHPVGECSSSLNLHNEDWLDFNMIQSGHGRQNINNYDKVSADYERLPVKPVVDAEPRYEDHPIGFNAEHGYFDEFDVRQAAYWAVFAGAFGHTYGHHSIWSMCKEPEDYFIMHWKDAIMRPAGNQMQHLRTLIESRPFLDRIPDQSLVENYPGANHVQATRGFDYAFIYSPNGLKLKVSMGKISGEEVKAYWYDPRLGNSKYIGKFANSGTANFAPPSSGRGNDWVLVLDDAVKEYGIKG